MMTIDEQIKRLQEKFSLYGSANESLPAPKKYRRRTIAEYKAFQDELRRITEEEAENDNND